MAMGWKDQYHRYKDYFMNISLLYKRREDVKMFLEIILSLMTITIFSVFALRPTVLTIAQLVKDNKTKQGALAKLNEKISALSTAKNLYEQESSNISLINYAVPDKTTADSLIRQIELLAGQNSTKILNFTVDELVLVGTAKLQPPVENLTAFPPESGSVDFSITVTGDYPSLSAFQKALENLLRPIKMDSVKIFTVVSETGNAQNLTVKGRSPYLLIK